MAGRKAGARQSQKTATVSTRDGELKRHLALLGLESAEAYRQWCVRHGFGAGLDKGWRERRAERDFAERLREREAAGAAMADHFGALGVEGEAGYLSWCRAHGFAQSLSKRPRQKADELLAHCRETGCAALETARGHDRRTDDLIRAIATGQVDSESLRAPHLLAIHEAFQRAPASSPVCAALLRLILHCRQTSRLLSAEPALAHLGACGGNTYIAGLLALARHFERWIEPPETWTASSRSARKQFSALARHLLARYEVPVFMDAAWLTGDDVRGQTHQEWFVHIGCGRNIRTADTGLHLTKRAAHLLPQAPNELPVEAALRWSQVRALGGEEPLARALIATRLAEIQDDEPFWQSVIFFFINNPMLDYAQVGSIVDYVHNRRFVPAEVAAAPELMAPPEPQFSMKGRTGLALLRRVDEWHRELARESKRAVVAWEPSGIAGWSFQTRDEADKRRSLWTIEEILTSRGLQDEGKEMRHCVASYAGACARGTTSIWSLRLQEGADAQSRRVMTIEVQNARRTIVQARGRCNRTPGDKRSSVRLDSAPAMVRRWAAEQRLTIPSYLFP